MSARAISQKYKCNPAKIGLDRNPYIQVDIDRLIGHMKSEIERTQKLLNDPEIPLIQENEEIRKSMEYQIDFYEGLLGTIAANSFK